MSVLLVVGILIAVVYLICRNINRLRGLPPGPTPLPIFGNILTLDYDMMQVFLDLKKEYGDVFTIWFPTPHVVINSYEVMRDTMIRHADVYSGRAPPEQFMKYLCDGNWGLFLNYDSIWLEQKRFALHSLRDQGFGTNNMQDTILFLAHRMIDALKEYQGEALDMTAHISSAVGNVITSLAFGKVGPHNDTELETFRQMFNETAIASGHPAFLAMEFIPGIKHLDKFFGNIFTICRTKNDQILDHIEEELVEHENTIDYDAPPKCYVDAFLQEMKRRRDKGEDLGSFTRHQLKIASYDMYAAGLETTVTTLRFTLLYMINNKTIQEKIIKEIDETLGKRDARMDDQKDLPYVNAVIQEIHRIANIIPMNFARKMTEPAIINGYKLPAGTAVIPQFQSVHMDPEIYERPDYFCPERHLDKDGAFVKDPRITPFSVGKRACLGEPLAKMEIFLFFVTLIQHFRFTHEGLIPPALDIEPGMLRAPKPYRLRAIPRE